MTSGEATGNHADEQVMDFATHKILSEDSTSMKASRAMTADPLTERWLLSQLGIHVYEVIMDVAPRFAQKE